MFHRIPFLVLMVLLMASPSSGIDTVSVSGQSPILSDFAVQIWRDEAGVPHVVASSTPGAYWGFGYCMARDRLLQFELLRRSVQGTLSEIFGETFLEQDFLARRDGLSQNLLKDGLARVGKDFQVAISAFTSGVNSAVKAASNGRMLVHPAFRSLGIPFRSFSEIEILEIFSGTMACRYNDFTQELDNLRLLNDLVKRLGARSASQIFDDIIPFIDKGVYGTMGRTDHFIPALPRGPRMGPHIENIPGGESPTLRQRKRNRDLRKIGIPEKSGSYAAVLSLRGQGKNEALLLGGPQMGYFTPSALYEIGLHTPDFDLVGTTPVGYFVILFGANRQIGFTATAGVSNQVDILMLDRQATDSERLTGERCETMITKRTEQILVKGRRDPVHRLVEDTTFGPIIGGKKMTCYVKHRGWKDNVIDSYSGWFASNHARTLDEWMDASDLMALSINWLGADMEGHLAYVHCGLGKSRRSFGDDRLPVRRPAFFPFPDIRLGGFDPATGFFANWNCPPVSGFRNGDLQTGWSSDQRSRFLADQIEQHRGKWSIDFLKTLDKNIAFTDLRAYFFKDDLVQMVKVEKLDSQGQDCVQMLREWDGMRSDRDLNGKFDSFAPALFDSLWKRVFDSVFLTHLGEMAWMVGSDPTWTQSALLKRALFNQASFDYLQGVTAEELVTACLASAVADLASSGRPLDFKPAPSMEFSGVNHAGVPSQSSPATFTPFMNRGSDVQIMRLTPEGITLLGVLPPGNTETGKHATDQVGPFQSFAWRERPVTYRDVRRLCNTFEVLRPQ